MPTPCSATGMAFGRAGGRELIAAFDGGRVTSDAGALLLGATDQAIRLVDRFAACFRDGRRPAFVTHRVRSLVGQRIFGLALGYEDLVDHDALRHDPVLGSLLGRFERDDAAPAPLAGKSTLNRLEHAPAEAVTRYHKIGHDAAAIEAVFVDLFLDAFGAKPPREIILDLDATDDPIHGHQEGRFFHGYYDSYCYLPLYIFCGRRLLAAKLRRSNIDASAGAVEEAQRIVRQIQARWPRVKIVLRADSAFARKALMLWCEQNRVDFVFGLARKARLETRVGAALQEARTRAAATGRPARVFRDFLWST
jgi:Transposase DDE domain group 1